MTTFAAILRGISAWIALAIMSVFLIITSPVWIPFLMFQAVADGIEATGDE